MIGPLDVATAGVLAWVGTNLVVSARRGLRGPARRHWVDIVRGLRPANFVAALPVLALVVALSLALLAGVPPLRFGWWTAVGGVGNPALGASSRLRGTPLSWLIPAAFLALLVPLLPFFAEREELLFRKGAERWTPARRVRRALEFGLVHALIGIPIGVALALSIGGGYFIAVYLRACRSGGPDAGVLASTRAHLAYNLTIVVVLLLALAAQA